MDRINSRIAQVYGYAVCLICVIVILISANQVINGAFDYANPLASGMASGRFGAFHTRPTGCSTGRSSPAQQRADPPSMPR